MRANCLPAKGNQFFADKQLLLSSIQAFMDSNGPTDVAMSYRTGVHEVRARANGQKVWDRVSRVTFRASVFIKTPARVGDS
jgi:hypothetical protein